MAAGPRKGKMKRSKKAKTIAYTPLTEKEKDEAMRNLIKRLNDPKDPTGDYRSPGGDRYDTRFRKV